MLENKPATDSLGNLIILGQLYGYSQQSNGSVTIVIGIVEKINELKVTLNNVKERRGLWGEIEESFKPESRRRSVNACHLFPIIESTYKLGDKVTTEYYNHGEVFEVVGIRKHELELRGDWSGGTHNVDQTSWYDITKCKLKI